MGEDRFLWGRGGSLRQEERSAWGNSRQLTRLGERSFVITHLVCEHLNLTRSLGGTLVK